MFNKMEIYPLKLKSVVSFKTYKCNSKIEWSTDSTMWTLIKEDKFESVENILLDLDAERKEALLNGSCKAKQEDEVDKKNKVTLAIKIKSFLQKKDKGLQDDTRPLFQCVTFGSFKVLKVLLKHGADIMQVAENQWNIIHYLIVVSSGNQPFESKAVKIYCQLLNELEEEDIHKLLMMEDANELRPLELAVHAGCLQFFDAIINTPGVYLINRQRKGLKEISWYDVTDYEDPRFWRKSNRQSLSPILLLSYSDRKVLKSEVSTGILRKGVLKQWARRKFICNSPFIWIWFCLRLVFIVSFFFMISIDSTTFLQQATYLILSIVATENNSSFVNQDLNRSLSIDYCDCTLANVTLGNCYCISRNNTENMEAITIDPDDNDINASENCLPFTGWYMTGENLRTDISYVLAMLFNIGYLIVYILCSILFDTVSVLTYFCSKSPRWKSWDGKSKDIIASNTFYRLCQFVFIVFVSAIIEEYASVLRTRKNLDNTILNIGLICSSFLSVWSILYFVQLIPSIGQFVNSIRRMLGIMLNFIIVYLLMLFPYPHAFMVVLKTSGCQVPGFESLVHGAYSSFKVMLNMLDISTYKSGTSYDKTGAINSKSLSARFYFELSGNSN